MVRRAGLLLGAWMLLPACSESGSGGSTLEAPAALGASIKQAPDVDLRWEDHSAGETGFRLEVNEGPFGEPPYLDAVYLPAGAVSHRYEAPPGRTLRFRVYAISSAHQSAPSNEAEVRVPAVPDRPANFSALALDASTVELRWTPPADADDLVVRRSSDGGATWQTVAGGGGPVKLALEPTPGSGGWTAGGQPAGTELRYRLAWVNDLGAGREAEASTTTFGATGDRVRFATTGDDGFLPGACVKDGILHAVHYDASTGSLRWSRWEPSLPTEMIDGPQGFWPAVLGWHGSATALDDHGRLRVAAQSYEPGGPRLYLQDGGWSALGVDVDSVGAEPRLAAVPGAMWMLYRRTSGGLLRLARMSGAGSWQVEDVPASIPAGPAGFAASPDGAVHVICGISSPVHHRRDPSGAWSFAAIVPSGAPGACAAVVGPEGTLHAAWHDIARGELWYARTGGSGWAAELVHRHTGGNLGDEVSMSWDGTVHLAYRNSVQNDLWYARRGAGGWERRLVDHAGDVGRGVVVAASGGTVFLAYRDATSGDLKAVRNP